MVKQEIPFQAETHFTIEILVDRLTQPEFMKLIVLEIYISAHGKGQISEHNLPCQGLELLRLFQEAGQVIPTQDQDQVGENILIPPLYSIFSLIKQC